MKKMNNMVHTGKCLLFGELSKLTEFLLANFYDEIKDGEVDVDVTIRLLKEYTHPIKRICKNCKYWGELEVGSVYGGDGFTTCRNTKFIVGFADYITEKDQLAFAASLATGEEFGCIHFEEKGEAI